MWECLAANHSHPSAQEKLAFLYKEGLYGVPQDLVRACLWYGLADASASAERVYSETEEGSVRYKTRRELVAEQMTPGQIAETERLVAQWKPNPAECQTIGAQAVN